MLDRATCEAALIQAHADFEPLGAGDAPAVAMPLVLTGLLGGVLIEQRAQRAPTVVDCRLALALLAWSRELSARGVTRVEHLSTYRPGARVRRSGRTSGHARALALDAAKFHFDNGLTLDVQADWGDSTRGADPCAPRQSEEERSRLLRALVCSAVTLGLFQIVLTPHFDRAHENHVHLEVRPDVDWTYFH